MFRHDRLSVEPRHQVRLGGLGASQILESSWFAAPDFNLEKLKQQNVETPHREAIMQIITLHDDHDKKMVQELEELKAAKDAIFDDTDFCRF